MNSVIDQLQQLGFSEYETKAYIALLQQHPLNGYALAKRSGVPRANIYGVLQKLEERGAVIPVTVAEGLVYSPISPDDLISRLGSYLSDVLTSAQRELKALATPIEQTYVQNLQGSDHLLEHARELIDNSYERLLIALWQPEAHALADPLARAQSRGVVINILCCQACPQECGGCQGSVYRYRITPDQQAHGLIIIQGDSEMLVGTTGINATAIRTRQSGLIEMTAWYLRH
ncbi:MAG: TrmB family transcriptional regulator, partial [Anaerolineae bacterium]|nr:TrmB family transcriptional regulator [Anaerolineae bacterium]